MLETSVMAYFLGVCGVLAALGLLVRIAIFAIVKRTDSMAAVHELPPVELAYLLRDGDMGHTMIVMAVDLVQRAVKDTSNIELHPYERQVWSNAKDFAKNWAQRKTDALIPLKDLRNPLQWLIRARALKTFFADTLRTLVQDVVKDPRNIKRYFSVGGIARLAVEMYTSSSRQGVETSLRGELAAANLLVPESKRHGGAIAFIVLAVSLLVALALGVQHFISGVPDLIGLLVAAILNALFMHVMIAVPGFIPSYDEFEKVSSELGRKGFRMELVRNVIRFGKTVFLLTSIIVVGFLLLVELAVNGLAHGLPPFQAFACVSLISIVIMVIIQAIKDAHFCFFREIPTDNADRILKRTRERLAQASPLQTFGTTLSSEEYDPTLSELVAVYGIETLWLLS